MKTRIMDSASLFALVLALSVTIWAQQPILETEIGFPFVAAGNQMPAGHYHISHPVDPNLVILQNDNGGARAVVFVHVSNTGANPAGTKLVFTKYGDTYVLSEIWSERDRELHQVHQYKAGQTVARGPA